MNVSKQLAIAMAYREIKMQKTLSKLANVSKLTISNMHRGEDVSLKTVEKIAKALDYSVSEFLALGE
jgi:DNA-binding Xre family transcriptional regulator